MQIGRDLLGRHGRSESEKEDPPSLNFIAGQWAFFSKHEIQGRLMSYQEHSYQILNKVEKVR